jgi:microcompartment protein CcmL/EutN
LSDGPALALIELGSIARGHRVADAMLKRAPVTLLRNEPVSPGKFLVLVAGDVASVEESFAVGLDVAADRIVDNQIHPQAHDQLWPALRGEAVAAEVASLGIVETNSVAATLLGADAAAKAARVRIIAMQLARGIGGKGYFTVTGPLDEVEAAVEAATTVVAPAAVHTTEIIPAPHEDLITSLAPPGSPGRTS